MADRRVQGVSEHPEGRKEREDKIGRVKLNIRPRFYLDLMGEAKKRGTTPAKLLSEILEEWSKGLP